MTKITIDIDPEDIIDNINTEALMDAILEDVDDNNPIWWTEKICEPMSKAVKEAVTKDDNRFIKEVVEEYVENLVNYEALIKIVKDVIKESLKDTIKEVVEDEVGGLLTAFINSKK